MKPGISCYAYSPISGCGFPQASRITFALPPAPTGNPEQHDLFLAYARTFAGDAAKLQPGRSRHPRTAFLGARIMPRIRLHFMQLCAITDRREATQPLVSLVESWSAGGVHFIQLREKDLSADAVESLAREIMGKIDRSRSKLLVNVSTLQSAALAVAAGADGVHLAGKPRPGLADRVRQTFRSINPIAGTPIISCALPQPGRYRCGR